MRLSKKVGRSASANENPRVQGLTLLSMPGQLGTRPPHRIQQRNRSKRHRVFAMRFCKRRVHLATDAFTDVGGGAGDRVTSSATFAADAISRRRSGNRSSIATSAIGCRLQLGLSRFLLSFRTGQFTQFAFMARGEVIRFPKRVVKERLKDSGEEARLTEVQQWTKAKTADRTKTTLRVTSAD